MSPRLLTALNAGGVLALGALALAQWRDNAALRTRVESSDRAAAAAAAENLTLGKALATAKSDLDDFRERLARAEETRRRLDGEIAALTRRASNAESQVAALKENVAAWHEAVKARDARLAEYAGALDAARKAQAEAVDRHNTLARDHNAMAARFSRLLEALGPDAAPVRLTREAVPALTRITEPGKARRSLTAEEAEKIVAGLVGREGHAYVTAYAPPADAPPPTLVEGENFRLFLSPSGAARFERPDLKVYLPAPPPAP